MNYRKHKDLTLSEIGVGFYGLSGAYGPKDLNAYRQTIHRAYELGVNFFDTAEGYGDAERIMPLFMELYGLKNSFDQEAVLKLENIRIRLEALLLM